MDYYCKNNSYSASIIKNAMEKRDTGEAENHPMSSEQALLNLRPLNNR